MNMDGKQKQLETFKSKLFVTVHRKTVLVRTWDDCGNSHLKSCNYVVQPAFACVRPALFSRIVYLLIY